MLTLGRLVTLRNVDNDMGESTNRDRHMHAKESLFLSGVTANVQMLRRQIHPACDRIITCSPELDRVFQLIERVAQTQATVLVLGESGTGKELIARAIHEMSGAHGAFVPVNCAAIPDNLLESELFGYERGAFTGATSSKLGRFALADNGTIFLDEIGDMSPQLQVKLLRVLQDRIIEPVGGTKSRPLNVRVIAATHVNLRERVRQGLFREDLFYRLQVVPIELPPLRDRGEDILLLGNYFAGLVAANMGIAPLAFAEDALEAMLDYHWPGNVRELENLIERLTILVDQGVVTKADLPSHMSEKETLRQQLEITPVMPEEGIDFNQVVEDFENGLIKQALEKTGGNKKAAADLLGLNRTTLVEKIKKKGLEGLFESRQMNAGKAPNSSSSRDTADRSVTSQ